MIKNKRNKRIRVLSIITLAAMLATTFSLNQNFIAFANEKTEEYTVVVENNDGLQKLRDDYSVSEDNAPLKVDGEFAVTAELTDRQVNKLSDNEDIKCIEKDFELELPEKDINETVKPIEYTWGLEAGNIPENTRSNTKIKVALIDSGIDDTDNIIVKERKNFILDKPVETPLFEDTCGHGTSVASMICGMGVESDVKGTNSNIELYSARVLDENRQAPISRIVSAIYWAIEKDVDIINTSFGTNTYSDALKTAMDDAEKAGIIVVAATGNDGTENIDYPAAFDNTIAVGSVNAKGEMSEFSSRGAALDVLAPGEAVLAQGNFGEDLVLSGTSLSTGYMTGVISLLLDRDKNISVDFVKTLIKESSKKLSNASNADYGIVDYRYALSIYDRVEKQIMRDALEEDVYTNEEIDTIEENSTNGDNSQEFNSEITDNNSGENENTNIAPEDDINIEDSNTDVIDDNAEESKEENLDINYEDYVPDSQGDSLEMTVNNEDSSFNPNTFEDRSDNIVSGSWKQTSHEATLSNETFKKGAVYSDNASYLKGMIDHPEFHGYSWRTGHTYGAGTVNYIANYRYLMLVAFACGRGDSYTTVSKSDVEGISDKCYQNLKNGVKQILTTRLSGETATYKRNFLIGIALHTAMDAFAHSAFQKTSDYTALNRIAHPDADDVTYVPGRYEIAKDVRDNVKERFNKTRSGNIANDFHGASSLYSSNSTFKINKMRSFAVNAGVTKSTYLSDFAKIN